MIDLKTEYRHVFRITYDESAEIVGQTREERLWLCRIPARRGHIFVQGVETLGAYCDRPRLFARLLAIPGVKVLQRGDTEINATFPRERIEDVAQLLHAKRRRRVSDTQKQRLVEMSAAFRAQNHPQRDEA